MTFEIDQSKPKLERDAIHIAIVKAIVGSQYDMHPGEGCYISVKDNKVYSANSSSFGIINPFIQPPASSYGWKKGDEVEVYLMPNSIQSLKHEWTHPVLDRKIETKEDIAEAYFEECALVCGRTKDQFLEELSDCIVGERESLSFQGFDTPDFMYEEEFWEAYKIITKIDVPKPKRPSFSCSC